MNASGVSPIDRIDLVVQYIEDNIDREISYDDLAGMMHLSLYEFRRIFSYVCGIGIAEYIRRRRLTHAAYDLMNTTDSISAVGQRYGYDSQSSFSRAFRELHGVTPTEVRSGSVPLSAYPKLEFKLTLSEQTPISYRIERLGGFWLYGYMAGSHTTETGCCEDVWDDFFSGGYDDRLKDLYRPPLFQAAGYMNPADGVSDVTCIVGACAQSEGEIPAGMQRIYVKESLWAVIKAEGLSGDLINRAYDSVLNRWLPESPYERDPEILNMEVFSPETPEDEDTAEWEIWLPVRMKGDRR